MSMLKTSRGEQGMPLVKSLFFETCKLDLRDKYVSFTLKDQEHKGYPSLRKLYLSFDDPTEYAFATEVFGDYKHWKTVSQADWFQQYIQAWRDEQEVRLRSQAIAQIASHALGEKGYMAAKWIAEGSWKPKPMGARTKAARQKESAITSAIDVEVEKDLKRLRAIN